MFRLSTEGLKDTLKFSGFNSSGTAPEFHRDCLWDIKFNF